MFKKLRPDFTLGTYRDVTVDFLRKNNIGVLLIDIDNTLAPYEQELPDEAHVEWFRELQAAGIRIALVSNNKPERVRRFNAPLGLPAYANSKKPRRKYLLAAMSELHAAPTESAILGDQLFTDAYAGNRLGLRTIIVPPIKDKKTPFFRIKRGMERCVMHGYKSGNI